MKYQILSKEDLSRAWDCYDDLNLAGKRRVIVSQWFYDREFFIDYLLSHYKRDKKTQEVIESAEFHGKLLEYLRTQKNLNVVYPRDHAKTTNSLFDSIWDVCYEAEPFTLLVAAEWLWVEFIWKIREEFITNEELKACFWDLVPTASKDETKKRTAKTLQFTNGCVIETISKGGTARWKRPTKIKVDDPQENKDVKNPRIAEEFVARFFTSIYNTLDPNGRCIVLGTVINANCFVNVLEQEDRWFLTVKFPAIIDPVYKFLEKGEEFSNSEWELIIGTGRLHIVWWKPIRRTKRSLKALDERLWVIKRDAFHQEYMHEPMIVVGDLLISKDIIRSLWILKPIRVDREYEQLSIFAEHDNRVELEDGDDIDTADRIDADGTAWRLLPKDEAKTRYSRGVDTATWSTTGDFSTIVVRDNTWKTMLTYRDRTPPDRLCEVIDYIYKLGYYPKRWAMWIENNNTWLVTIIKARDWDYDWYEDIYVQEVVDEKSEKRTKKVWWNTNGKTRAIIVEWYRQNIVTEEKITDFDIREIAEMKTFAYNQNWKAEAVKPYHDDLILASMISMEMMKVNRYSFGATM